MDSCFLHSFVLDVRMERTKSSESFGIVSLHGSLDVVENLGKQSTTHIDLERL